MNKKEFNFIQFCNDTKLYLDLITACSYAVKHYANIQDDKNLQSIASSLCHGIDELVKIFKKNENEVNNHDR